MGEKRVNIFLCYLLNTFFIAVVLLLQSSTDCSEQESVWSGSGVSGSS